MSLNLPTLTPYLKYPKHIQKNVAQMQWFGSSFNNNVLLTLNGMEQYKSNNLIESGPHITLQMPNGQILQL